MSLHSRKQVKLRTPREQAIEKIEKEIDAKRIAHAWAQAKEVGADPIFFAIHIAVSGRIPQVRKAA
jgi:hypothetical protein